MVSSADTTPCRMMVPHGAGLIGDIIQALPRVALRQAAVSALGTHSICQPQQEQSSRTNARGLLPRGLFRAANFPRARPNPSPRMLILHQARATCSARARPWPPRVGKSRVPERAGRARVQTEKQAEPARHMANSSANMTSTMTSIWRSIVLRLDGGSVAFFITCRRRS